MKNTLKRPSLYLSQYNRLIEGKRFADETGGAMEYSTLVRAGYKIIHSYGLFKKTCYEWRKVIRNQ